MGCGPSKASNPKHFLRHLKVNEIKYDSRIIPIYHPSQSMKAKLIDTIVESYYGDDKHLPDKSLEWIFQRYSGNLSQKFVSQQEEYQYFANFYLTYSLKFGVVYAIKDKESEEIAGVLCLLPPGSVKNGELFPDCRMIQTVWACGIPKHCKENKRCEVIHKAGKYGCKQYAQMNHWNLQVLAIKPEFQNQGIGKAFMDLLIKFADLDRKPCYLECTGEQIIKYFENYDFQVMEKIDLKEKHQESEKCEHKFTFMLRYPKFQNILDKEFETIKKEQ